MFLFFFVGHGFTVPDGSHLLICANDHLACLRYNRDGIPVDLLEEITNGRGCNRASAKKYDIILHDEQNQEEGRI